MAVAYWYYEVRRFLPCPKNKSNFNIVRASSMARGPNQKAVAAAEKKAANQAVKDADKARQNAAKEAEEWKKGSNTRAASKAEEAGEP